MNTAFCGPVRDTLLSNRNAEKLNYDTNYINNGWYRLQYILLHPKLFRQNVVKYTILFAGKVNEILVTFINYGQIEIETKLKLKVPPIEYIEKYKYTTQV